MRPSTLIDIAIALLVIAAFVPCSALASTGPSQTESSGTLIISSNPPEADVWMDGVPQGEAPITVTVSSENYAAPHIIEVRHPGYQVWRKTYVFSPSSGNEISIAASLIPLAPTGFLVITSEPIGAVVWIDGDIAGVTPLPEVQIGQGSHIVELDYPGYQAFSTSAEANPVNPVTLHAVLREIQTPGQIVVSSSPSGAEIVIDGKFYGFSPRTIGGLAPGNHSLNLLRSGFGPYSADVTVPAGGSASVEARLLKTTTPGSGSIDIMSLPPGGDIYLDGSYKGFSYSEISTGFPLVREGYHSVLIHQTGYLDYERTVQVREGDVVSISAMFEKFVRPPENGTIFLTSDPSGAHAYIDGAFIGISPLSIDEIPAGLHTMLLKMPGYKDWTSTFTSTGGWVFEIAADLDPATETGSIEVTSSPPGSYITVDANEGRYTPCTFGNLPVGMHRVEVSSPGYQPLTVSANVNPGQTTPVNAVLKRAGRPGLLSVDSVPQSADVYVDGKFEGMTPIEVGGLAPDTSNLTLVYPEFLPYSTDVTVRPGETTTVNATLSPGTIPGTGSVSIGSLPSGGRIFIDGTYRGFIPPFESIDLVGLPGGTHDLLVRLDGYLDYRDAVEIAEGRDSSVSIWFYEAPDPIANGTVMVISRPAGGYAYLDGQFMGMSPVPLYHIPAGEHELVVKLAGYEDWSDIINVPAGRTSETMIDFIPVTNSPVTSGGSARPAPLSFIGAGIALIVVLFVIKRKL